MMILFQSACVILRFIQARPERDWGGTLRRMTPMVGFAVAVKFIGGGIARNPGRYLRYLVNLIYLYEPWNVANVELSTGMQ